MLCKGVRKLLKRFKRIFYRGFDNKEISYNELNNMVIMDGALLIDVRSIQEYNEGHLEGAINIPVYDLENNIYMLPNINEEIIVYCASGHRSRQAKKILENYGYTNVYNLKNGLDGI